MLVLFGDSFASVVPDGDYQTWFEMLADKLGVAYKSYAIRGSSFEYSTLKFYEYLQSDWSPDDIIIFVLTSANRSPVVSSDFDPSWAALTTGKVFYDTLSARDKKLIDALSESNEHYTQYKQYYRDWVILQNDDLVLAQRFMLLKCLHSLSNKTISISGWEIERKIPTHFENHINGSLSEVAANEITTRKILDLVEKYGKDFRRNHLHESNHCILSDLIYKKLIGEEVEFSTELFHKNLYHV